MTKKIAILSSSAAFVLGLAGVALADISNLNVNEAYIEATAIATANTGGNSQDDGVAGDDVMTTGDANAYADITSEINENLTTILYVGSGDTSIDVGNVNFADVYAEAVALSDTGSNTQNDEAYDSELNDNDVLFTGTALSEATAGSWVNVNISDIVSIDVDDYEL